MHVEKRFFSTDGANKQVGVRSEIRRVRTFDPTLPRSALPFRFALRVAASGGQVTPRSCALAAVVVADTHGLSVLNAQSRLAGSAASGNSITALTSTTSRPARSSPRMATRLRVK